MGKVAVVWTLKEGYSLPNNIPIFSLLRSRADIVRLAVQGGEPCPNSMSSPIEGADGTEGSVSTIEVHRIIFT